MIFLSQEQLGSGESNWIFRTAKFPKQGREHRSGTAKPDCNAMIGRERPGTKMEFLIDIKSLALEPDTGKESLASNFAHSDLGLLPIR